MDTVAVFQYVKGANKKRRDFLPEHVVTGQWDNGFKLKKDRFRLDIRQTFFTMRVGKC